jgi:hypothetical protein
MPKTHLIFNQSQTSPETRRAFPYRSIPLRKLFAIGCAEVRMHTARAKRTVGRTFSLLFVLKA